jgi:hypothetical protein
LDTVTINVFPDDEIISSGTGRTDRSLMVLKEVLPTS